MKLVNKFLIRLFLSFLLLFTLVISDKYNIINLDKIKTSISYNINPLNIINKLNGTLEIIDLGSLDEQKVTVNQKEYQLINNKRRYYCDEYEAINNYVAGVITKVEKKRIDKKITYNITILGIDNNIYNYYNVDSFDHHIYKYLKTDEIIGSCSDYYELMINKK